MIAAGNVIQFPTRHRAPVVPFRPPTPRDYTITSDPELPSAVTELARRGLTSRIAPSMICRALTCRDEMVHEARIGALIAMCYEHWTDPDVCHIYSLVVLDICPSFTPARLSKLFRLAAEAMVRHDSGQDASGLLVRIRAAAVDMVTPDDGPGAA